MFDDLSCAHAPGPNFIAQFRFDAATGRLRPNAPFKLEPNKPIGPRHYCLHPTLDLVYFSDEQGCSVTAYPLDRASGTLSVVETTPSLPALTPSARFIDVGNRGRQQHRVVRSRCIDGEMTPAGHAPTEAGLRCP
jgi:6-phosphogluconolactonase